MGQFAALVQGLLAGLPFQEAAGFPIGEVLFVEGPAVELVTEDLLDLGQAVEPLDEADSGFAVIEALVELIAQGARETGDFTCSSHKIGFEGSWRSRARWKYKGVGGPFEGLSAPGAIATYVQHAAKDRMDWESV